VGGGSWDIDGIAQPSVVSQARDDVAGLGAAGDVDLVKPIPPADLPGGVQRATRTSSQHNCRQTFFAQ
jgi:hypothetical protein